MGCWIDWNIGDEVNNSVNECTISDNQIHGNHRIAWRATAEELNFVRDCQNVVIYERA